MTKSKLAPRLIIIGAFALVAVFFILYTIVWQRGAAAMRAEIARFAEAERAIGRTFTYGEIETDGWPFTLRGTIANVTWSSPEHGSFNAEELIIAALPYDASRVILAPRGEQRLIIGDDSYDLTADDLRFSIERGFSAMQGANLTLTGETRTINMNSVIANRQSTPEGLLFETQIKQALVDGDHAAQIPYFDMAALRNGETLRIAGFRIGVGDDNSPSPTQLAGEGELTRTESGTLSGKIELKFKNEGPLIDILGEANAIEQKNVNMAKAMLGMLTDAGTKEMTLPLVIEEGEISLGAIPIGRLPSQD